MKALKVMAITMQCSILSCGGLQALNDPLYQDGVYPNTKLLFASDGNIYGTTYRVGTTDKGTIFRATTSGTLTTLTTFTGTNGSSPYSGLIQGTDGYLYGTTFNGGFVEWRNRF